MKKLRNTFPFNILFSKKKDQADPFKKKLEEVKHEHHDHDIDMQHRIYDKSEHSSDYDKKMMNSSSHNKLSRGSSYISRIISWANKDNWRRGKEKKK